jgi:predicted nuclease with TOPRIM domain
MTRSKLEQAVTGRASQLNDAQREIIASQFFEYKNNKERLLDVREQLRAVNGRQTPTLDELRRKQGDRSALVYEQAQLSMANSRIASDLFRLLGEDAK